MQSTGPGRRQPPAYSVAAQMARLNRLGRAHSHEGVTQGFHYHTDRDADPGKSCFGLIKSTWVFYLFIYFSKDLKIKIDFLFHTLSIYLDDDLTDTTINDSDTVIIMVWQNLFLTFRTQPFRFSWLEIDLLNSFSRWRGNASVCSLNSGYSPWRSEIFIIN